MNRNDYLKLFLIATVLALAYGIWYSYSVFLVAFDETFNWSRSTLAAGFSIFALVHGVTNPISSALCDRVNSGILVLVGGLCISISLLFVSLIQTPFDLFLYFGVFTAISVSMCGWGPSLVQVQRSFKHNLGFAIGFVSSGIGVGMVLAVPLIQLCIDSVGWRNCFRILSAISFIVIIPIGLFLTKNFVPGLSSQSVNNNNLRTSSLNLSQAFKTGQFWLLVSLYFFGSMGAQTLHVHQVVYLVEKGISPIVGASVVSMVGLSSIFGKLVGGYLSDKVEREKVFIVGNIILITGIFILYFAGERASIPLAYLFAVCLGIGYSSTAAIAPAIISDHFGGKHFGKILGIGLFGGASGAAVGPFVAGELFDNFGNYKLAFIFAVVSILIASLCCTVVRLNKYK